MNERLRELREAEFDAMWHCNAPKETKKILSDIKNYQLVIDFSLCNDESQLFSLPYVFMLP